MSSIGFPIKSAGLQPEMSKTWSVAATMTRVVWLMIHRSEDERSGHVWNEWWSLVMKRWNVEKEKGRMTGERSGFLILFFFLIHLDMPFLRSYVFSHEKDRQMCLLCNTFPLTKWIVTPMNCWFSVGCLFCTAMDTQSTTVWLVWLRNIKQTGTSWCASFANVLFLEVVRSMLLLILTISFLDPCLKWLCIVIVLAMHRAITGNCARYLSIKHYIYLPVLTDIRRLSSR